MTRRFPFFACFNHALFLAFFIFFVPSQSYASLRLATWNMEWLSDKGDILQGRRNQNDYLMMQQITSVLDADFIAFQEVDSLDALEKVIPTNEYQFFLSERASEQTHKKKSQQYTGWAVRHRHQVINRPDFKALALPNILGKSNLRYGSYIELIRPDAPNLHMLSVHLKSGCFGKHINSKRSCDKLRKQINALAIWIQSRVIQNQAFIIAGDFNHYLNDTSDWVWQHLTKAVGEEHLVNLTQGTAAKCKSTRYNFRTKRWENVIYQKLIDHFIASPSVVSELLLTQAKQYQYSYHASSTYRLPDHCPIFADLTPA